MLRSPPRDQRALTRHCSIGDTGYAQLTCRKNWTEGGGKKQSVSRTYQTKNKAILHVLRIDSIVY